MKYAYSSSLKIVIAASTFKASKFSSMDLYCPCCGERVSFFTESFGINNKRAHFRHYHGTYRKDCENYAIGVNSPYRPNKKINEIIQSAYAIYFEKRNNNYSFLYSVKFTEAEIQKYQAINSYLHLTVVNNKSRDIKTEINHVNFVDGKRTFIRLGDAGQKIISVLEDYTSQIDFIRRITFFKMLGDGDWTDNDFIAKKVPNGDDERKYKLFLNEKYILVVPKYSVISNSLNVIRSEKYIFENVDVYFIEFNKIDISAKEFCAKGGYELCEGKAVLDILWPPCVEIEDSHFVKGNSIRKLLPGRSKTDFGVSSDVKDLADGKLINAIRKTYGYSDAQILNIFSSISEIFLRHNEDGKLYIALETTRIHIANEKHQWYKCLQCGKISPFKIGDYCGDCYTSNEIIIVNHEALSRFEFWRTPLLNERVDIHKINTEEHTAQPF